MSRASAYGHSQLKHQQLRVDSYMENLLINKWFNYPHARAHLGCELLWDQMNLHRWFVRDSLKSARQWRKLYRVTKRTNS